MTRLLIVDDKQENLYMLQVLLSANGFEVELASNGAEALERARRAPPDLIISDILMPGMDGFALCRAWKEDARLKHIPFVFYTATYTDTKDEDFALSLGAERFIVKPVEPDKFLALLLNTIETHKAGQPAVPTPPVEEVAYYREYNAALIRKLEDKMLQLAEANRILEHDIAEIKRAEEERRKLQDQMIQAQKLESVGRLAGGIAHDFNNMLVVILGHTELAMKRIDLTHPIHADLEEIQKAARRSADLTNRLLGFARKQTVAPKILDLNKTVDGMLKMLRRLIGEDIDLAWLPGAGLWSVNIDPAQVDQVLANLCVNARDAIAGVGKVTIETHNVLFDAVDCSDHMEAHPGEYVLLAVSDNGRGMDQATQAHLFEPFFTTKEIGQGTGLGLATVYGIVRQNNGFITLYSQPGQGTTFKVYLPRFAGMVVEPTVESTQEAPKGHGEMVLLVEDEALNLNVTKAMLEDLGYEVLTACTPGEALQQARAHAGEIGLLITDVVMPEMNGWDLARLLREIRPDLKCLFSSGYTADVIAHRSVLDEGVHFLQKPFTMRDLAINVRKALERE
jgi:signal transduction histidine kinase